MPKNLSGRRELVGLTIGSITVFFYFFAISFIDYIKSFEKLKYVDYDVKTVTAGDYTVEFDIDEKHYDFFVDHYLQQDNPISEIG